MRKYLLHSYCETVCNSLWYQPTDILNSKVKMAASLKKKYKLCDFDVWQVCNILLNIGNIKALQKLVFA